VVPLLRSRRAAVIAKLLYQLDKIGGQRPAVSAVAGRAGRQGIGSVLGPLVLSQVSRPPASDSPPAPFIVDVHTRRIERDRLLAGRDVAVPDAEGIARVRRHPA